MDYTVLPSTDIKVSKLCLGTMTFGNQNTEAEGHAQMDYALERGINFFDTAELYPVPATPKTYADTERIMGNWFKKTGKRDQIVLTSKIAGSGDYTAHIRDHEHFSPKHLREAVEGSLKRLQTDYLDLYQLHWPERKTNFFSVRGYRNHPDNDPWEDNFEEILATLATLIEEGKIKQIGLSNETPWGIMRFVELAKQGYPKMITVQNPYNLLNRLFEVGNSEVCMREDMGLLAYSPLGFGRLTGKYRNGMPENSRF
jgi:aryl-alcohol dehydrogenase-like predicted oxidoreductase